MKMGKNTNTKETKKPIYLNSFGKFLLVIACLE